MSIIDADVEQFNHESSINYFKEDNQAFFKFIIGYFAFLILPIFFGYFMQNAHDRVISGKNKLAEWQNPWRLFMHGFKMFVVSTIIFLPTTKLAQTLNELTQKLNETLAQAQAAAEAQAQAMAEGVAQDAMQTISATPDVEMVKTILIVLVVLLVVSFLAYMYLFISLAVFIVDFRLKSFFNFKAIGYILKNHYALTHRYLTAMISYILIFGVTAALLIFIKIGIFLIPVLAMFILCITSDIQAQYVREIFKKKVKK